MTQKYVVQGWEVEHKDDGEDDGNDEECTVYWARYTDVACLRLEFGSGAAAFRAMAEEVPTCDKGPIVGTESWTSF